MLQNLPDTALQILLSLLNRVWVGNSIPHVWKKAIIIPVPKAEKDQSLASSYHPISLTSCVCKLLDRMINRRLLWTVEKQDLLANIQSGFRPHRSITDHLVSLSTQISSCFALREHLVAVFFHLEKAHDTT